MLEVYTTNEFLLCFFGNLLLGENNTLKNREMHVHYADTVNDLVNTKNDPVNVRNDLVNDPVKRSILHQLKQNPKANYNELADKTGYSAATIKRHIQELKKLGLIERIGSDKTGYWKITEK